MNKRIFLLKVLSVVFFFGGLSLLIGAGWYGSYTSGLENSIPRLGAELYYVSRHRYSDIPIRCYQTGEPWWESMCIGPRNGLCRSIVKCHNPTFVEWVSGSHATCMALPDVCDTPDRPGTNDFR